MKWKNTNMREYYSKYKKVDIKNGQGWFEVYELPGAVYAICEPQHFQEVNSYLIIGSEKGLLFDTGMGVCDIELVVKELYEGELIVVNSHFHFDHIGDNYKFNEVYIFDDQYAKAMASAGFKKSGMGNQLDEEMFLFDYPKGFNPDKFRIPPYTVKLLGDGDTFDLGNRKLTVIHTPGHSNDSIMLLDNENRILFTGDTFYLGALYAHFDCVEFGKSSLSDYYKSMNELKDKISLVDSLYCSHNDFIVDPIKISEAALALESIIKNDSKNSIKTKSAHSYLEEESKLKEYQFNGFSIVAYDDK